MGDSAQQDDDVKEGRSGASADGGERGGDWRARAKAAQSMGRRARARRVSDREHSSQRCIGNVGAHLTMAGIGLEGEAPKYLGGYLVWTVGAGALMRDSVCIYQINGQTAATRGKGQILRPPNIWRTHAN